MHPPLRSDQAPTPSPTVRFAGVTTPATAGKDLLGLLLDARARITYACMSGSCGTCQVRVRAGLCHLAPRTDAEDYHCGRDAAERLACQAVCLGSGDVEVEQP